MTARQVITHDLEFGGDRIEVVESEAYGALPPFRSLTVRRGEEVLVTVLSERDAAIVSAALLPAAWWEALLRHAYRMGWAAGAEESGGVDRHGAEAEHPNESAVVARLLAQPPV